MLQEAPVKTNHVQELRIVFILGELLEEVMETSTLSEGIHKCIDDQG